MLRQRLLGRIVAIALVPALQWGTIPAAVGSSTGTIAGHVLSADSRTPLAGVQVHVGDPRTGEMRTSSPTASDGSFMVAGLLPSSYEIAVQSTKGVYLAEGAVRLDPGQTRHVQVAVSQQVAPSPTEQHNGRRGGGWWNNPLAATLIVLGSAVLIGVAVDQLSNDSNDAAASQSSR